jgi:hypothetical protein
MSRSLLRQPRAEKRACELVHIDLWACVAASGVWRADVMAEQPAKRIPDWLAIDVLVILVSLAIIVIGIWIGL